MVPLPPSYSSVRPSTSVGEQKGNQQQEENRVYQSAKYVDARVRDHLAAGVEKETREVTLRNGVRLPTALELIAKINIHYCNYFLRRGRAEEQPRSRTLRGNERNRKREREGRGER